MAPAALNFEDFASAVSLELGPFGDTELAPGTRVVEDAECDSLDVFCLVMLVEDLAGAAPGEADDRPIATFGDAYALYLALAGDR